MPAVARLCSDEQVGELLRLLVCHEALFCACGLTRLAHLHQMQGLLPACLRGCACPCVHAQ